MFKTSVIFLGLYLLSVHGFVKRDLESESKLGGLLKNNDDIKKALDPQNIKEQLDEKLANLKNKIRIISKRDIGDSLSNRTAEIQKALDPKNIQNRLDEQIANIKKQIDDATKNIKL